MIGVVEVISAEVGIPVCCEHFKDAIADLKDRDIECTAAEVEHSDFFIGVAYRGRRRALQLSALG